MVELPGAVEPIVADPVRPNIIYAGTNTTIEDASIWKSTDSGVTWVNIQNNLQYDPNDFVFSSCIDVDPVDPDIVYFGRRSRYILSPPETLVKSINAGDSWLDITPPNLDENKLNGVIVSPVDHNTIIVCSNVNGVLRSTDGGFSWEEKNEGILGAKPRAETAAADSATGIIYLGRHSGGIYRSTDNGDSWEKISYNITGAECLDIAANWSYPYTLFVATGNGLHKSLDRAESWEYVDIDFASDWPELSCVEVDPFDPSYVYAGYYSYYPTSMGICRSTNGGDSWQLFSQGLPADKLPVDLGIANYAGGVRRLYMATTRGLYRSDDLGENWDLIENGLPTTYFMSLDISPVDPDLVYVGTLSRDLYKSTDGGASWIQITTLPHDDRVKDIVCDPTDSNIIYINMDYPGYSGIFKSIDGGESWMDINNNLPRSSYFYTTGIAINPQDHDNIYVYSSGRGVFLSHNGGLTWEDFNEGLEVVHGYTHTLVDHNDTSRVFLAMEGNSVWWRSGPQSPAPCGSYAIGDYNGSAAANVADVVDMFSKLKTGDPSYPDLDCECPPESGNLWPVRADVNASCTFNVADVVSLFSYLKIGSPELAPCELCPPDPPPSPPGGEPPLTVGRGGFGNEERTGSGKD